MTRTRWTALAVALLCVALAAPAHAERVITRDAVTGDGARASDVTKVTTTHGRKRVVLKTRMHRDSRLSDEVWHLVDSHGDGRPDFLVFTVVASEVTGEPAVGVYRVDRWPTRTNPYRLLHRGERVDCGLTVGDVSDRRRLLTLTLGRGCFRTDGAMPPAVRLATFTTFEWGRIADALPSWRTYGRWVDAT